MATIPHVAQALQTVLTSVADAAAHTSGFVQRQSKLTGALFTQTLVFGFLSNPKASREQLAQTAAALGLSISPQALDQRLNHSGAECLFQVLEAASSTLLTADPLALPLLQRFNAVYLLDSSRISLPDCLAQIWLAGGNQHSSKPSAGLKLSLRLNLSTGGLEGPHLDHAICSDHTLLLQHAPIGAGALRIADLGFFSLDVLQAIAEQGGYWLTRAQISTVLRTLSGERLDLVSFLAAQECAKLDVPILLGAQHRLSARLLAVRVPQEVADERRRRVREEAKRRGRTPNAKQLALAEWTIFVTNVPGALLSVEEALVLGRARWQIELLFKLWKSQGQIDKWRSAKGAAILCELYAKLLGMLVQHWLMLVGCWGYADRSVVKAAATVRAQALSLASGLRKQAGLAEAISTIAECLALGCRINKRRKRPHTYQLLLQPARLP